ncbi:cap-specific mRNA (nucleoside-2'-O-)-methyltransferase 2 [Diprion similis]|uniref:cap-specific mRNA (nucleoside-2'-O-)-methyltransferase 2 n=1 Tax=Diprion similis TaxID=362088 RepID=UPI001EF91079|nr:cap-specific mRNA (nucleoside-2'-O-)-methyltransferase 2 [Diprion similis]
MGSKEDRFGKKRHLNEMSNVELPKAFTSTDRNHWRKRSRNDKAYEPLVESLFKKQFLIENDKFIIPKPETMFTDNPWDITKLQILKRELNDIKNKLNDYDIAKWHQHTRRRNRAGDVQWRLRNEIDPEFLTQAWCKFYENLSSFPLVPNTAVKAEKLLSVHLCEAPGAFVTSLNHWLRLNAPNIQWDWIATTLNPYYEGNPLSCMINDDRFIISSLNQWCFGSDYTGNVMNLKNMTNLVEKCQEKGDVLLVTADGSIDCTNDPGEQESIVGPLHYCEAVTGLQLLSEHGSLLLKMFTIFEHDSLCLVYLISCLFDQVFVNKPVTSKEGNSEIYLVCLDYRGPGYSLPYLNILKKYYEKRPDKSMFRKEDIPDEFFQQMISCGEFFKAHQSEVILKNIEAYRCEEDNGHIDFETKKIKRIVANKFISAYGLRKLENESLEVVGKTKLTHIHSINLDPRIPDGSYNRRRVMENLEPERLLLALCQNLTPIQVRATTQWFTFTGPLDALQICCGKLFLKVQSSKFCMGKFLKIRNRVFELSEKLGIDRPYNQVESIRNFVNVLENDTKNYRYLSFEPSITENSNNTLSKINKILENIVERDSLVLIGYSLLTQLNVGILYILAHMFQSLGVILNEKFGCIVILKHNLRTKSTMECFKEVHNATIKAEASSESVLSVLPITKLCESDLYPSIVDANHWTIEHCVKEIGDCVQKKLSTQIGLTGHS